MTSATLTMPFFGDSNAREFSLHDERSLSVILEDFLRQRKFAHVDKRLFDSLWNAPPVGRPATALVSAAFITIDALVTPASLQIRMDEVHLDTMTFKELLLICDHHAGLLWYNTYFPTGTIGLIGGVPHIPAISHERGRGTSVILRRLPQQFYGNGIFFGKHR